MGQVRDLLNILIEKHDSPDKATMGELIQLVDATELESAATNARLDALEARIKKLEDGHWQDRSDKYRTDRAAPDA